MSAALAIDIEPTELEVGALYDACVDVVWRVLARLGVPSADLEDAVQDTFVLAHRRRGEFRGQSRPSTWVVGIAVRVAHDHRRRAQRKPSEPLEPLVGQLRDERPAPDERAALAQASALVQRLLEQLEPAQRDVFVLIELEGLTAPEVAELTEAPLNTVYSRLRLARARFESLVSALQRAER